MELVLKRFDFQDISSSCNWYQWLLYLLRQIAFNQHIQWLLVW